jgi:hypothetical protein
MSGRSDEYRRLARECLAIAARIVTQEARSALIEMARVWSRLADEQDAVLPRQPAVQQQQQQRQLNDGGEPQ